MDKRCAALLLSLVLFGSFAFADSYVRQLDIDVVHYDISIEVTDLSDSITGIAKLQVQIRNGPATGMWLDFEDMSVDMLLVGGVKRSFTFREGRLAFDFDRTYSQKEKIDIEVRYHGKPSKGLMFGKNRYGQRVVFADNWPDRAHYWFPSIDHPSDKATVSFAVTAPEKYDIVGNGDMGKTVSLPYRRKLTRWAENKTIPTYCMVLGVAEFSIVRSYKDNLPLTLYVFPQDSEVATAKFRRTGQMLAYFESLIGPYPYGKLAQVESTIRLGAMENSSAIFYSEPLFESSSEDPVAHEIAHQWFGDSITESDWDHLWLSEGFATYFEALFYAHLNGPETIKWTMARYAAKIAIYRPALEKPVIDPSQTDPMRKLTPLNYEKGAWILHMLRGMLGDDVFFKGIRLFYQEFQGGTASSGDFQRVMETVSGTNLSSFFQQWLYSPGWPEYRYSWRWDESARELEISVRQVKTRGLFDMPVEFRVTTENRRNVYKLRIHDAVHTFRVPLPTSPTEVVMDPDNWILKTLSE